jgi:proteasome lid subunit RPN8/RPN11
MAAPAAIPYNHSFGKRPMDSPTESQLATWSTPQCGFSIGYSLRVVDEIRLAVMDAFFSLPRGGAEIGGILLGTPKKKQVLIMDYAPLDCEHAYGPSFTLSERDHAKLAELLAIAKRSGGGLVPVGWYHSHTRSEVFFSDADIAIHKKFFPEPWQVALVLKPHTFEPMRAGFFFREVGGAIRGESCYSEFTLAPQPMQALGAAMPADAPALPERLAITLPAQSAPQSVERRPVEPAPSAPEPHDVPVEVKPPEFLTVQPAAPRRWPWALAVLAVAGAGAGGYQTRSAWLPPLEGAVMRATASRAAAKPVPAAQPAATPKPSEPPVTLGLTTADEGGQLHITWDRNSPAVRGGAPGVLSISDGETPLAIPLDAAHLQTGSFTYGRQGGRVDVGLAVQLGDGHSVKEVATFVGPMPVKAKPADLATRKQRDDLAKEADRLKTDLRKQSERTKKLENAMDQMRLELLRQQRTRMENMGTDAPKVPARKQ